MSGDARTVLDAGARAALESNKPLVYVCPPAAWAALMVWALASAAAGRPLGVPPGRGELYLTVAVGAFLVLMLGRWVGLLLGG